ncbi:MAG: hypothetical protein ACLPN1_11820 [Dissulfurispiraceae bacterium]
MKYCIGIDIAGAPGGCFDIALITWDEVSDVHWARMPLGAVGNGYPAFNFNEIKVAAEQGNTDTIASLSVKIGNYVTSSLKTSIEALLHPFRIDCRDIAAIGIDSPSGFSRNTMMHGRATERVSNHFGIGQRGNFPVYFQMTPSICCGKINNGTWFWMLFGMAAFYAFVNKFHFEETTWRSFIQNGYEKENIIEVFPGATIQYLRQQGQGAVETLQHVLNNVQHAEAECHLIKQALETGESTGSDKADALIAALTMLPFIDDNQFGSTLLKTANPENYMPCSPNHWNQEGIINLLKVNA